MINFRESGSEVIHSIARAMREPILTASYERAFSATFAPLRDQFFFTQRRKGAEGDLRYWLRSLGVFAALREPFFIARGRYGVMIFDWPVFASEAKQSILWCREWIAASFYSSWETKWVDLDPKSNGRASDTRFTVTGPIVITHFVR